MSRVSRGVVRALARRMVPYGTLELEIAGRRETIRAGAPGPGTNLVVNDADDVVARVVRGGSVGFAEAYIAGSWDTDDLAALLEMAARAHDARRRSGSGWGLRALRTVWARTMRRPEGSAVAKMVDHYDLGNDFYEEWLDDSMTYSSAIFDPGDDLEAAQRRKYERLVELGGIRPGDTVLDIGCGWGALAEYLATELGCRVTAVTISAEQHAFVTQRIKQAGVDDLVSVRLEDFREVEGVFDRVVSVEMIESIEEAAWPDLFAAIERSLLPGGTAALQVITIDHDLHVEMVGRREFIRSYIFPGGALPSTDILRHLGSDVGLEDLRLTSHGASYAETLAEWDRRFVASWPAIMSKHPRYDQRFFRMWRYYLAYCQAGFRTGRLDGVQVAYRKPPVGA